MKTRRKIKRRRQKEKGEGGYRKKGKEIGRKREKGKGKRISNCE